MIHLASRRRLRPTAAVAVATFAVLSAMGLTMPPSASAATALNGTFTISPGSCSGGVSGSYFRMILHNGSPTGPFMSNSDSTCSNQTYTLLSPGRDHGLVSGSYQPEASPAFDGSGNALTDRITKPVRFYGVNFATATNQVDPQTRKSVPAPRVSASGKTLTGDLRAFAVSWNNQRFNQGSPKPDGSMPGNTRAVTGSYDSASGVYTLQWTSQIQGGPFDGFTGLWHLTGRFIPAGSGAATQPSAGSSPGSGTRDGGTTASTAPVTATPAGAPAPRAGANGVRAAVGAPSASAVVPAPTGSAGADASATSGSTTASGRTANLAAVGHRGQGSPRWPWVLVAVVAVAGVAWFIARRGRSGSTT